VQHAICGAVHLLCSFYGRWHLLPVRGDHSLLAGHHPGVHCAALDGCFDCWGQGSAEDKHVSAVMTCLGFLQAPAKFASAFTLGSALMMASFFALKGFQTQLKYMMEKERLLFSIGAHPDILAC
jgi:Got1/Sft2-like family